MNSEGVHLVHTWLLVPWTCGSPGSNTQFLIGLWGMYSSILLKSFWCQLSLTAHCLSTSARDKDMEWVGGLQKNGLLLEGELIPCVWCNWEHGTETDSNPRIHDLASFFWMLVVFRGSCLWDEVICKGLWAVCDNALTSCVSSLLCFPLVIAFPPPLALSLLQPFKDEGFFLSPDQNPNKGSLGIWWDFPSSSNHKQYLEAPQECPIAWAALVSGSKRADKTDGERWGWCCWGKLSVSMAFDASICSGKFLPLVVYSGLLVPLLDSSGIHNFPCWWNVTIMGEAEELILS